LKKADKCGETGEGVEGEKPFEFLEQLESSAMKLVDQAHVVQKMEMGAYGTSSR